MWRDLTLIRGLQIHITCCSSYGIYITWLSLYGNTADIEKKYHCFGYSVALGCAERCIVLATTTVTSQWYCRYCFKENTPTWAGHIAKRINFDGGQFINYFLLDLNGIYCQFQWNNYTYTIGRDCKVGNYLAVLNKCMGLWTSETYGADGSAGDAMCLG